MLRDRIEGKDSFFRNDELRATPGGGEATRGSLSCDDTVPTEPFRRAKFHVWEDDKDSCIVLRLPRGKPGGGMGMAEAVGDIQGDS